MFHFKDIELKFSWHFLDLRFGLDFWLGSAPRSKKWIRRSQNLDFSQTWNFQEMFRFQCTSIIIEQIISGTDISEMGRQKALIFLQNLRGILIGSLKKFQKISICQFRENSNYSEIRSILIKKHSVAGAPVSYRCTCSKSNSVRWLFDKGSSRWYV